MKRKEAFNNQIDIGVLGASISNTASDTGKDSFAYRWLKNAGENSLANKLLEKAYEESYAVNLIKKADNAPDKPVFIQEYLIQLGKRVQMYWGTTHPKHFIRTFSEIEQLLKSTRKIEGSSDKVETAAGLSITIINEDDLQKVRLAIRPYFQSLVDDKKDEQLIKPFYISRSVLEDLLTHWKQFPFDPANLKTDQPIGFDFCIGKQTPDQELYDYYIIVQVVDLCHERIVDMTCLPVSIPTLSDFQLIIP